MNEKKISRLNEININNQGLEMKIIEYKNARNILIEIIKTKEIVKSTYDNFKKGNIKSYFYPTVYGFGSIGEAESREKDGNLKDSYRAWVNMLIRCYKEEYKIKNPTYKDVSCCEEWRYYSNFEKWHNKSYYKVDNETMCLDKDILVKGNKIYSPDTCIYVPHTINMLFVNNKRNNLPKGIHIFHGRYKTQIGINGKRVYLGTYDTIEEAFEIYKQNKEKYIKEVADAYKDKIPKKLYDAMYRWEVEIDD